MIMSRFALKSKMLLLEILIFKTELNEAVNSWALYSKLKHRAHDKPILNKDIHEEISSKSGNLIRKRVQLNKV